VEGCEQHTLKGDVERIGGVHLMRRGPQIIKKNEFLSFKRKGVHFPMKGAQIPMRD
jgi:hypothetical protein